MKKVITIAAMMLLAVTTKVSVLYATIWQRYWKRCSKPMSSFWLHQSISTLLMHN